MKANVVVKWDNGPSKSDSSKAIKKLAEVAQELVDLGITEIVVTPKSD